MKKIFLIKKRFSSHGGGENYMRTLIEHLKNDFDITVLSGSWVHTNGVRFRNVPVLNIGSYFSVRTFNSNVCRILKNMHADCVISFERTTCQDIYRAGEGCHAEWLEIRSRIEPLYRNLSFKVNPLHISLLKLEKNLFAGTSLIIANSGMVKKNIIKHYAVPAEKIMTIYNGVDLKRFNPDNKKRWGDEIRKKLGISQEARLLLFVGSGFKRKGLGTLINSIPLVKENDLKVLVIGKGDAGSYLKTAEKLGIGDRIIFSGPQKEIERFYAAADIFVLPTLYDPFSNATLEAMASGIPVITAKGNGAAEIITDGQEGYAINDPFDKEELADRILLSLENLTAMGKNARAKAENFSIEKAAATFTDAIKYFMDFKKSKTDSL